jgi:Kef-type K+ transport system membrane component KefB
MELFIELSLAIAILILAAKLGGYLSYRLGQPAVLGELLVGILLGPSIINLLNLPYFTSDQLSEVIQVLAEIGVMLLMFLAGLELHLEDLIKSGKVAALAGICGVILPLALGAGLGLVFHMEAISAIYLGLILSATSVSISAQVLMELKVLRTPVGIALLGAAVFDDILVILGLSIFTAVSTPESASDSSIVRIILEMLLFLGIASAAGWYLLPKLSRRVNRLPVSQGLIAFVVVVMLLYGWLAEELGHMAPITGAFLAGLFLARSPVKERIENGVPVLAYAFFVPVFFISVGLSANARLLVGQAFWLFLSLLVIALVGKLVGSGIGARLGGMNTRDSLRLGVGMISRGEVGLIVATVGLSNGLIDETIFAAVIGVVLATTIMTPLFLRMLYREKTTKGNNSLHPEQQLTKNEEEG